MALLEKLPSNASKHFPGRTVFEAAELGGKLPKMSPDTANVYMRTLGSLFRYALDERMIDADPSNGLLFQKSKVRAKDKRLPFTPADLAAIFSAPLYSGCEDDESGYARPGPKIVRRGRFWVPLIALFSGMRLNEICQLTLDDFDRQDDTDIILIRGSDDGETKRVKTEAGERFVPVHPELKRLGLLDFVVAQRSEHAADAPLFQNCLLERPATDPTRSPNSSPASSTRWASAIPKRYFTHSGTIIAMRFARRIFR